MSVPVGPEICPVALLTEVTPIRSPLATVMLTAVLLEKLPDSYAALEQVTVCAMAGAVWASPKTNATEAARRIGFMSISLIHVNAADHAATDGQRKPCFEPLTGLWPKCVNVCVR